MINEIRTTREEFERQMSALKSMAYVSQSINSEELSELIGSTLIGALKNHRCSMGSDIENRYVEIGLDRIERLKSDTLKTREIYQEIPRSRNNV